MDVYAVVGGTRKIGRGWASWPKAALLLVAATACQAGPPPDATAPDPAPSRLPTAASPASPPSPPPTAPASTATAASTFTPEAACRAPIDDLTRVTVNGEPVNQRTAHMLETAARLYHGPGDLKRVVQGSYTDAVDASFGTHAGGGVVDISIRDPSHPAERLFDEVEPMVAALRQAGFAAWYRDTDELYPGSVPHLHAVAVGDPELSEAARLQLDGPAGYFRGMNGLPRDPPIPDRHGGPVICPWMTEAGYGDAAGGESPTPRPAP